MELEILFFLWLLHTQKSLFMHVISPHVRLTWLRFDYLFLVLVIIYDCRHFLIPLMSFCLLQAHKDFTEAKVSAFVCDLTVDDLGKQIPPSSVDIVTMVLEYKASSI